MNLTYAQLRVVAIALTVLVAVIGLIQAAGPEALGFNDPAARWLGIVSGGVGVVLGFLPRVQHSEESVHLSTAPSPDVPQGQTVAS